MLVTLAFATATMALLLVVWRALCGVLDRNRGAPNRARQIAESGEVLGVFVVAGAAAAGSRGGEDLAADAARVAAFGLIGLVAFLAAGRLGLHLLLRGRLAAEIRSGNAAAGLVAAAHLAATALIVSRLFFGDDWSMLGVACVFLVVGQASLHLIVSLFRAVTSYDDVEEILDENLAAAVSYAGVTLAAGSLVAHAATGEFAGWAASMRAYGAALLAGLVLYPIRQLLVQCLILGSPPTLRGGRMDHGIARERDVGMGALEASTYVATALTVSALT
jgi:uncharacterized membrane protein YjfL (UPF0719 family)